MQEFKYILALVSLIHEIYPKSGHGAIIPDFFLYNIWEWFSR